MCCSAVLQLRHQETQVPDLTQCQQLAKGFADNHFVHLAGLIEPSLRQSIAEMISQASFTQRLTPGIGCVETCDDQRIENGFFALFNQPEVRHTISQIVGQPIDLWGGNTVRRVPGKNHFSNWHNDKSPPVELADGRRYQRVVPMSLNMSEGDFSGGNLEMRSMPEQTLVADVANPIAGDALLFEINETLQHRVADVTAGCPRIVHVGWFHRQI